MKNRLKSIAAPKSWSIKRKKNIWTTKPKGSHKIEYCLPIAIILRDHLKHAKSRKELKNIVYRKGVLVDNRRIKDIRYGTGIMDIVEIPEIKEKYVVLVDKKGKLCLEKTELKLKIAKIIGKKKIGKKMQLNLFGGKNVIIEKDNFKVGDTVLLDLNDYGIKEHIKLAEGVSCMLLGGSHMGEFGKIRKIEGNKIIVTGEDGSDFETLKKFVYVVGKDTPLVGANKK